MYILKNANSFLTNAEILSGFGSGSGLPEGQSLRLPRHKTSCLLPA